MKKILIVEDDRDLSFIISEMLESYGYSVTTAESGEEAFRLLSQHTYHLILLHVNLPDTTGIEICRELRKNTQIPVIFASARNDENDRIKGFDTGGDDYLPKPYSMKELLSRVNALIRRTYGFSEKEKVVKFGNITVNITARTVTKNGENIGTDIQTVRDNTDPMTIDLGASPKDETIIEGSGGKVTYTPHVLYNDKVQDGYLFRFAASDSSGVPLNTAAGDVTGDPNLAATTEKMASFSVTEAMCVQAEGNVALSIYAVPKETT